MNHLKLQHEIRHQSRLVQVSVPPPATCTSRIRRALGAFCRNAMVEEDSDPARRPDPGIELGLRPACLQLHMCLAGLDGWTAAVNCNLLACSTAFPRPCP